MVQVAGTLGNCSSPTTACYSYDGNGLRVKKAVTGGSSTVYIFSGSAVIAEYDNGAAPASPTRENIYAGGKLLATVTAGTPPVTNYYHSDQLSVRLMTDSNGNKIGEQGHYPFGESWYTQNSSTKWTFTSYERDGETGLDFAMARYYDSSAARFCSADPLGGRPNDPQSWNRYIYVQNDPVTLTDPSGQGFLHFLLKALDAFLQAFTAGGLHLLPTGLGTPPILPGDPGDDASVLEGSLNNPSPLSGPLVIQNLLDATTPATIVASRLGPCTNSLFGVSLISVVTAQPRSDRFDPSTSQNGSFTGAMAGIYQGAGKPLLPGPSTFTVTHDVSSNTVMTDYSWRLRAPAEYRADAPVGSVHGYTNPDWPLTDYGSGDVSTAEAVHNQIWELGNSLSYITGRHIPGHMNIRPGPTNNEAGRLLWDCYANSGIRLTF